jgi:hypothetical protein
MSIFDTTNQGQDSNDNANQAPSLANCAPATSIPQAHSHATGSLISRPANDEAFTTLADQVQLALLIVQQKDSWGNYAGETYHPVPGKLQSGIFTFLRQMIFCPYVTADGRKGIIPQKMDPPHSRVNSWNASLAEALDHPPGRWRRLWSDSDAQRYQHDLVSPPMDEIPEYPDFREDLEKALSPNIITSLDHPIVQRVLGKQDPEIDAEEIY